MGSVYREHRWILTPGWGHVLRLIPVIRGLLFSPLFLVDQDSLFRTLAPWSNMKNGYTESPEYRISVQEVLHTM